MEQYKAMAQGLEESLDKEKQVQYKHKFIMDPLIKLILKVTLAENSSA